jgi:hypothetical protein
MKRSILWKKACDSFLENDCVDDDDDDDDDIVVM